jgi:hypothetical protein
LEGVLLSLRLYSDPEGDYVGLKLRECEQRFGLRSIDDDTQAHG